MEDANEYIHKASLGLLLMCKSPNPIGASIAGTFALCILVLISSVACDPQDVGTTTLLSTLGSNNNGEPQTCTSDDLEHSTLTECNVTSCARQANGPQRAYEIEWPSRADEIIHIYSTRAGERFTQVRLPNIDFQEDERSRLLDINTTFYVESAQRHKTDYVARRAIVGFGATIDFMKLERALQEGQFQQRYGLVFDDLFGRTASSGHLTILRLIVDVAHGEQQSLQATLLELDKQMRQRADRSTARLKLMIDFRGLTYFDKQIDLGPDLIQALLHTKIWAISLEMSSFKVRSEINELVAKRSHQMIPGALLFLLVEPLHAPILVDGINSGQVSGIQGLLINSQPSTAYNYLEYIREHAKSDIHIITAAKATFRTKNLGDWRNAQYSAVELLNHLKYGSNGYIEQKSVVDVLCDPDDPSDASLYSLHQDHGLHLRGPRFYALGHFARYLTSDSLPLKTELFTQQNMFAAHYSAFLSADKQYIVGIVLNDNEHLLPFRMAIDGRIKLSAHLEPKSFNTFLIKLDS